MTFNVVYFLILRIGFAESGVSSFYGGSSSEFR